MGLQLTASPDELREAFIGLRSLSDLAALLDITSKELTSYSYGHSRRYRSFTVKKRRGGERQIHEPQSGLKVILQKLNRVLLAVYRPRACVQGFLPDRSIARNAQVHQGQRWVLNVDLKDFFPSIHFGRVRGMLMAKPYGLPRNVATVIAQLCCHMGVLPQGAPTSPVISNMVAARLDRDLERLSRRARCRYTRYADDITFSSGERVFPSILATREQGASGGLTAVGAPLTQLIEENDFEINHSKVRLQRSDERQTVTGLTVNDFPNVSREYTRRIRALLYAWEQHGPDAAADHYFGRYERRNRPPHAAKNFKRAVKGHIDFFGLVRGIDHPTYRTFMRKYAELDPEYRIRPARFRKRNHLLTYADAIWIIESESTISQGTAFELEGIGLVTCAHVVLDDEGEPAPDLVLYQPRDESLSHAVRVVAFDRDRDIAVVHFDAPSGMLLRPKFLPEPGVGTAAWVAGYPDHAPGATLWEDRGELTGFRNHIGSPRFTVSCGIAKGASGSPVFDESGAVIGIASEGAPTPAIAAQRVTIKFGVIPIAQIQVIAQPAISRGLQIVGVEPRKSAASEAAGSASGHEGTV